MTIHNLVSESEAANYAGVSQNTLGRFAEAGYLKIETDTDGLRFYSIKELEDLFGLGCSVRSSIEKSILNGESYQVANGEASNFRESENSVDDDLPKDEPIESAQQEATPDATVRESSEDGINAQSHGNSTTSDVTAELSKLRTVVNLQEKILDMQDEQLRSIRKECEWLRTRIERFEEKNERDQLLLLAETQMIRRFVAIQTRAKPSPLRRALEWVGLAETRTDEYSQLQQNRLV